MNAVCQGSLPACHLCTHDIDSSVQYSCTRKNNIKIDVKIILQEGVDWIDLSHDRENWWAVLKAAMELWVSQNVGNFLTG